MYRTTFRIAILYLLCSTTLAQDARRAADQVISIWPDSPPQWDAPDESEQDTSGPDGGRVADKPVIRLGFVSKPELHVYRPNNNGSDTAVLICPGGGYSILAWDLEGTEIAQWLQGIGVTAIIVKYRVPTRRSSVKWLAPVQDIQRSISLCRSGAIEGVTPKRIGVLGFSAGGNASARVATASKRHYAVVDKHDQANPKPDFAVLVYPAWIVKEDNPTHLTDGIQVTKESPPMFFAHAADDRINCMSSVTLFGQLKHHGVASSLHVFASGGHGFGGRKTGKPTDAWKDLCATWMSSHSWLTK